MSVVEPVVPIVEPVVTWGADFWQKVLISATGTAGAALVALMIFWLTRLKDRRNHRREWRIDTLTECADRVGDVLQHIVVFDVREPGQNKLHAVIMALIASNVRYRRVLGKHKTSMSLRQLTATLANFVAASDRLYADFAAKRINTDQITRMLSPIIDKILAIQDELDTLIISESLGKRHAKKFPPYERRIVTEEDIFRIPDNKTPDSSNRDRRDRANMTGLDDMKP